MPSISKGRCVDQDDLHSLSSTRSSTDASSIAARRQRFKGGKEKPEHTSAALRYLTRQQEVAKQCADHVVLLDAAVQRLEKEERWHTETSAQHGTSGIKHAANISKIVEAMGTLRDEWLIQNGTSDSALDELQKLWSASASRAKKRPRPNASCTKKKGGSS